MPLTTQKHYTDFALEFEQSNISNPDLWKYAMRFYVRNRVELLPIFPILFIPIWTDCFHSVLIRQLITNNRTLQPMKAIGETMRLLPAFASTKLKLLLPAYLWGFIPIIGWYKGFTYRLTWAMASNVHVFERDASSAGKRCTQLVNLIINKKRTDALMIVPIFFFVIVLILIAVLVTITHSAVFFWIGMFFLAWILFPGSAIVNTLVYLSITNDSAFEDLAN